METDKAALRAQLRAARARRPAHDHAAVADAVRDHLLALPVLGSARRVATYLALPTEPSLAPLHEVLLGRGTEVVVPVVVDGESLDWVALTPGETFMAGRLGILEPSGPRLGPGALAGVDLVLAPALAVDHAGHRLGQGAGYYDRALQGSRSPVCAVVFADELLPEVPHEPHDVPVQMAVTEQGVFRVPQA